MKRVHALLHLLTALSATTEIGAQTCDDVLYAGIKRIGENEVVKVSCSESADAPTANVEYIHGVYVITNSLSPTTTPTTSSPSDSPTTSPTKETSSPTPATVSPTKTTSNPTTSTANPTRGTEAPSKDTATPTTSTKAPSVTTLVPTLGTKSPTGPTTAPTRGPTPKTPGPTISPTIGPPVSDKTISVTFKTSDTTVTLEMDSDTKSKTEINVQQSIGSTYKVDPTTVSVDLGNGGYVSVTFAPKIGEEKQIEDAANAFTDDLKSKSDNLPDLSLFNELDTTYHPETAKPITIIFKTKSDFSTKTTHEKAVLFSLLKTALAHKHEWLPEKIVVTALTNGIIQVQFQPYNPDGTKNINAVAGNFLMNVENAGKSGPSSAGTGVGGSSSAAGAGIGSAVGPSDGSGSIGSGGVDVGLSPGKVEVLEAPAYVLPTFDRLDTTFSPKLTFGTGSVGVTFKTSQDYTKLTEREVALVKSEVMGTLLMRDYGVTSAMKIEVVLAEDETGATGTGAANKITVKITGASQSELAAVAKKFAAEIGLGKNAFPAPFITDVDGQKLVEAEGDAEQLKTMNNYVDTTKAATAVAASPIEEPGFPIFLLFIGAAILVIAAGAFVLFRKKTLKRDVEMLDTEESVDGPEGYEYQSSVGTTSRVLSFIGKLKHAINPHSQARRQHEQVELNSRRIVSAHGAATNYHHEQIQKKLERKRTGGTEDTSNSHHDGHHMEVAIVGAGVTHAHEEETRKQKEKLAQKRKSHIMAQRTRSSMRKAAALNSFMGPVPDASTAPLQPKVLPNLDLDLDLEEEAVGPVGLLDLPEENEELEDSPRAPSPLSAKIAPAPQEKDDTHVEIGTSSAEGIEIQIANDAGVTDTTDENEAHEKVYLNTEAQPSPAQDDFDL